MRTTREERQPLQAPSGEPAGSETVRWRPRASRRQQDVASGKDHPRRVNAATRANRFALVLGLAAPYDQDGFSIGVTPSSGNLPSRSGTPFFKTRNGEPMDHKEQHHEKHVKER